MKKTTLAACALLAPLAALYGANGYRLKPADLKAVKVTGGFWLPRVETNRIATVRCDLDKCESTGRLENFRKAARHEKQTFKGIPYDDSDVFKVIEGAAYTLATHPDPKLDAELDDLISWIAKAQEPDGYLYTARTLGMEKKKGFQFARMMGRERWDNTEASHELYNMGHLIEAGVAHWQATGKRTLLDVAIKCADMMDRTFGDGPGQIRRVPGHQEVELALCRLYEATGEKRYLDLARRFLDFRGNCDTGRLVGLLDHLPVRLQKEAAGHAVRAGYMYSAMADVAAFSGDGTYRKILDFLWMDVTGRKMHLTGGIGAYHKIDLPLIGHVGEGFGLAYDLPNETAYLETCAAIANALWQRRMFLASGDAKYVDVFERIIYNGFLSGVSFSGTEFFYPNPLASKGGYMRKAWFRTSCCPVNVVRFIPQIAPFAYATEGNTAYVNLFIESEAKLSVGGDKVCLSHKTAYPWNGTSEITVTPGTDGRRFALKVRIPGWARGKPVEGSLYSQTVPAKIDDVSVAVNGSPVPMKLDKGYLKIDRKWKRGDVVKVNLPLDVKLIKASTLVEADRGRLAVERGPVVWCAEGVDNGGKALNISMSPAAAFSVKDVEIAGNVLPALETTDALTRGRVVLVPYFAWCHRGAGEMQTWFRKAAADQTQGETPQVKIVDFKPYMHAGRIAVRMTVTNTQEQSVSAVLTANIGPRMSCATNLTVAAGRTKNAILKFGDVPANLDMADFGWNVAVESPDGTIDARSGTANAAAAFDYLAKKLIARQAGQPNARYSDVYFADVYAARSLMGLGQARGNAAWRESGRRWVEEGLIARQFPDGGYPMGYSEDAGVHWVADNGTAAMGVVAAAALFPECRDRLLASVKRYYGFRDSFYQSPERVAALEERFGRQPQYISEGFYGIGVNDGDYVERRILKEKLAANKQKLPPKPENSPLVRTERGGLWVNGISLLSLPAYWRLTDDAEVLDTAQRDLANYVGKALTVNYFGAETLYNCVRLLPESGATTAARALLDKFVLRVASSGGKDDVGDRPHDKGGRNSLNALTAVYMFNDSTCTRRRELRSYIVCMMWYVASPEHRRSVYNAERLFGKPGARNTYWVRASTARYQAMTMPWLAEMLSPGCTLIGCGPLVR